MRQRGRAVARRVGQHHRRFEARHQALVAVGGGVGERVDRLGVLEDAADVPQRDLRQAAVAVAGEQVVAALGQRLVHVHARAVVADQRLRHEGRGLAVAVRDVACTMYFRISSSSALRTSVLKRVPISHWPAVATSWWWTSTGMPIASSVLHISPRMSLERVDRRHREVAALDARAMAGVAAVELLVRRPRAFFGVDLEAGGVHHVVLPAHGIEDEELRLRAEKGRVGDAGGLQVGLGALGRRTRVSASSPASCSVPARRS